MHRRLLAPALLALMLVTAAPSRAVEPGAYVATIQTAKGKFRAVITDPAMVALAQRELAGEGDAGVPIGPLAWGDGGINKGHRWHVTDLTFADFTIELCDGTARMVDRETEYWVQTVGSFCPWSGEVVKLKPLRER